MRDVIKLRRRYKDMPKEKKADPLLGDLLRKMENSNLLPGPSMATDESPQPRGTSESLEERSDASIGEIPSDLSEDESRFELDADFSSVGSSSYQGIDGIEDQTSLTFPVPRIQLYSADRSEELNQVLQLTKLQYQGQVQSFLASSADTVSVMGWMPLPGSVESNESLAATFSFNKTFWQKVKSGIYYFKQRTDGDKASAIKLLIESSNMIKPLCEQQSFPMWKDIFATLSPTNIAIEKDTLSGIMQTFTVSANEVHGQYPEHPLALIFSRLQSEDLFEEACTTGLLLLLELSNKLLPAGHEETFEIERTLVRLCRRQGSLNHAKLADAKRMCRALIEKCERWYGKHGNRTCLGLTELVYILNDQGRYLESKGLAEAVEERYRGHFGNNGLPNQRHIYAMEDVAYIYDKLERPKDSVFWLRKAQSEAISLWSDKEGTEHITRKLEEAQAKISSER